MLDEASIYDFKCQDISGTQVDFSEYRGKVIMLVNVASKCGFTPQYAKLEQLYQKYKSSGLVILGFPCNQFARQEPGDAAQICKLTDSYQVSFPMFAKTEVIGDKACSLYKYLRSRLQQHTILPLIPWNFTKIIVDREGIVRRRFLPWSRFSNLEKYIESLLTQT